MTPTQPATSEPAPSSAPAAGEPTLERTIGGKQMAFYGLGGMLGAGTTAWSAARPSSAVWLAFLVSMVAALLTGLSYACIGSRYPRAGVPPTSPIAPTACRC